MFENIKKGFFIGIGLLIPLAILEFASINIGLSMMSSSMKEVIEGEGYDYEDDYGDDFEVEPIAEDYEDYTKSYVDEVVLLGHDSVMQGVQLLIRGQLKNESKKELSTISIEAELMDINGKFVYECSNYIREKLAPNQTVNYIIKCGCNNNGLPEFATVDLKVTQALEY